jgi:dTDP-4-amino-4,6-dideoxygalactose transaminase
MVKQRVADLGIFGGTPAFPDPIHVGRPNLGDRQALLTRINDILDRRWLTNDGAYVQEFERRIAEIAGTKHCIALSNATVGLEIAVKALDLTGEVIVPSFTFVATAHALEWHRLTPVFADVDPHTHLIDPRDVEARITPRTSAIVGVHLWGQVCDVKALQAIADRHGLQLILDAAHAFGCATPDGPAGGFGALEVFSFHATKFVNSLEGGAIVTNDDDLARRVRLMRNFGFLGYDNVGSVGTNAKLTEFNAAMGLTSIDAMDEFVCLNRRNHVLYGAGLADLPGLLLKTYDDRQRLNYQYVVAEVDPSVCPISRDRLLDLLWADNVRARRYFYPGVHRMEPYCSQMNPALRHLPATERVSARVLVLPNGETATPACIERICALMRFAVERGSDITAQLELRGRGVHADVLSG